MSNYNVADSAGNVAEAGKGVIETITANRTLTVADSGKTFLVGTDALVITLPATVKGCKYKFVNSGAAGNNIITVAPVAADGIAGTITLAATVVVRAGTVNTSVVNTKATSQKGDTLEIEGTGVTGTSAWLISSNSGIWA